MFLDCYLYLSLFPPTQIAFADGSTRVEYDHIFKIILIGDNGVGKSSFIRR